MGDDDFSKCTQCQGQRLHFEETDVQQHVVSDHTLDTVLSEEASVAPRTRRVRIQVFRIETLSKDGPSPPTKTDPVLLPEARAPEEREVPSWGTNAP